MVKIDHIGIAVNSLRSAVPLYAAILGENPADEESVPSEGVHVTFFGRNEGRLELLEPADPDGPIARFLERRGPGLHHVCLAVPDLDAALGRMAQSGIEPVPPGIRTGAGNRRVAFVHPRDASGVLLELAESRAG